MIKKKKTAITMALCAMVLTTGSVTAFAAGGDSTIAGKTSANSEFKAAQTVTRAVQCTNDMTMDKDGNLVNKEGEKIDTLEFAIDKDGNLISKEGKIMDTVEAEAAQTDTSTDQWKASSAVQWADDMTMDKDGNLLNIEGKKIDTLELAIEKDGNLVCKEGKIIDGLPAFTSTAPATK